MELSQPANLLVVPTASGDLSDIAARSLANEIGVRMGQQVVVENRPGAGGIIAYEMIARATPDGYTLGYVTMLSRRIRACIRGSPTTVGNRPIGVFSTFFPAKSAQIEANGRFAPDAPWLEMRGDRQSTSGASRGPRRG